MIALWEIMVPHKMGPKGKKVIQVPYHQEWDAKVREIAGGLTIMRAARGQWVDRDGNGKLYKEIMIPVRIACTREQIEEIMAFTQQHYKQIVVMAYKVAEEVIMRRDDAQADA